MRKLNKKLKAAVIGIGHQSLEDHIPAILASPDIDLASVVETNQKKLKSFLTKHPTVKGYSNFDIF